MITKNKNGILDIRSLIILILEKEFSSHCEQSSTLDFQMFLGILQLVCPIQYLLETHTTRLMQVLDGTVTVGQLEKQLNR